MYFLDGLAAIANSGSAVKVLLSIIAILLSAVPAAFFARWLTSLMGLDGTPGALLTVAFAVVTAVALFALLTTLGRKAGVFK